MSSGGRSPVRLLHSYASDAKVDVDGGVSLPSWMLFVRQRGAGTILLTALTTVPHEQDNAMFSVHDLRMTQPMMEQHIEELGIEIDSAAFVKLLVNTLSERKAVDVQSSSAEHSSDVDVVLTYRFSDSISRKGRLRLPCVAQRAPLSLVSLLLDLHETKNVPVLTELQRLQASGPSPTKRSTLLSTTTTTPSIGTQASQDDAIAPSTAAMLSKKRHLPIGTARRKGPKGAKLSKAS
ncbi:hypothetical protein PINS_up012525 [Pythium insidiosum]|nr:hypothetical protein PINS_up012525 [Pythium insidiosum]